MRSGPRTPVVVASVILLVWAQCERSVHAQPSTDRADQLFSQGKAAMAEGRIEEACRHFAESLREEHALGSLLNLAYCNETAGRTATAWGQYAEAAALARTIGDAVRGQFAEERAEQLHETAPRLRLLIKSQNPKPDVWVDGKRIVGPDTAEPLLVDPGPHRIRAASQGRRAWVTEIAVEKSSTVAIVVPVLLAVDMPDETVGTSGGDDLSRDGGEVYRIAAVGLGGAGVVALGLGTYFGISALARRADSNDHCTGRYCDEDGLRALDDAGRDADRSTALLVGGTAALGAGVWMFLGPGGKRSLPTVQVGADGKSAMGTMQVRW